MNPFLAPLRLFVRSLNMVPGVSASMRTEHVEVEDRLDDGGRRVLLVRRGTDPEAVRRAVAAGRGAVSDDGAAGPEPLVRFDVGPDGETATVVVDDPDATVELGRFGVTVHAEGIERSFDLPFDPSAADRRVSNGVLTADIE
ncbi:hypothetical protein [Haloglomus litoreum]|uniref:hypothetical protein n=1 Tax=Haloglomus litoreum TaxID=3034026 RepID=UPI0023E8CE51|nr:hypothetical protein [Haloglomus sp. DT116]